MPFAESDRALHAAALDVMRNAHAAYSAFPVGAALRAPSGTIYAGCNVENASFPEGWCAETSAIAAMVSAGERKIEAIAVVAEKLPRVTPCGGCRQRIREFAEADTPVILCDMSGPLQVVPLVDLLPLSFDKAALT